MQLTTTRKRFLYGFLLCLAAFIISLYFQFILNESPCQLCIIQRVDAMILGVLFLLAFLHNPNIFGTKVYGFLALLLSLGGMIISLRQVWLQHLPPDEVPACGPGLSTLFKMFPPQKAITLLFQGTGDCAEVHGRFLTLSLAAWSAIFFVVLSGLCLRQLLSPNNR